VGNPQECRADRGDFPLGDAAQERNIHIFQESSLALSFWRAAKLPLS